MKKLKKYYRITFTPVSPLSVGSGEDRLTDSDIVRDSRGIPYIPGTSLAGVYRRLFDNDTATQYFGPLLTEENATDSAQNGKNVLTDSSVVVYDARIADPAKTVTSARDMVALDEYKTAIPGAKFDFEILEPGVTFVTYIEQNIEDAGHADEQYIIDEIAWAWLSGTVKIGAKTGRGYGSTKCLSAEYCCFDLSRQEDVERWLAFDMYSDTCEDGTPVWIPAEHVKCLSSADPQEEGYAGLLERYRSEGILLREKTVISMRLELDLKGGISVRQYSTDVGEADYMQLTENPIPGCGEQGGEGVPVIPGTSWAGAFRAQMEKLDDRFRRNGKLAELFFGKVKGSGKDSSRSRVCFSESRLSGGRWVTYTRNAIDRFSGGTTDGALYTEKTYYNGGTTLDITCDMTDIASDEQQYFIKVLMAAVMDLHCGYMAVGGLTSVGRGIFEVKKLTAGNEACVFAGEDTGSIYGKLCQMLAGEGEKRV